MQLLTIPDDEPQWLKYWEQSPERAPFAHPAYLDRWSDDNTRCCAAVLETDHGCVFYPFLLRTLHKEKFPLPEGGSEKAFDLISPYGYGGPEAMAADEEKGALFRRFYAEFHQWALENNVVSEFVRFSLFSEARKYYYGTVEHNNDNIVVGLQGPEDTLWSDFRHKVRKNITTARGYGVSVEEDARGERLDDFLAVYAHTMQRRKASPSYGFSESFFKGILQQLPGKAIFFHALHKGRVLASELLLCSTRRIYSFLGGTWQKDFHMRPSDLLKYHIIQWGREKGYQEFVIGGGHRPHDGIFAFKQSFAPHGIVPFYVGKHIFNERVYRHLAHLNTRADHTNFFPAYRAL